MSVFKGLNMRRLSRAFTNSGRSFYYLLRYEKAFQQEFILFILSLPIAFFIATSVGNYIALVGSVLFVALVEVLNTAIEATCNALTRENNKDIQIAKDAGSLAVLLSVLFPISIWCWQIITILF